MPDNSLSLTIGGEVKVVGLSVGAKLFIFTPNQQQFLLNLQKMKNVTAAALSIDKDEAWGKQFLSSRKFRQYLSLKMKSFSDKNGLDVEWWYSFGKKLAEGYDEFYLVACGYCEYAGTMDLYEAETFRGDDMQLSVACPACFKPAQSELKREEFKPSREQVEGWKTLGERLVPKTERVQHLFEKSEFVFESEGA